MVDSNKFKTALINELRKYLEDPANRGTSRTETFSGNGIITKFELTPPNDITDSYMQALMYVDSVSISSTEQKLNREYSLDFGRGNEKPSITFVTAPTSGTDNISVTYYYGENWIYPGTPNVEDNKKLPRIGFLRTGGGSVPSGVGDQGEFIDFDTRISIWVRNTDSYTINSFKYTGDKLLDFIENDIYQKIRYIRYNNTIHGLIKARVTNVSDIPFDSDFGLNRREISLTFQFQQWYNGVC